MGKGCSFFSLVIRQRLDHLCPHLGLAPIITKTPSLDILYRHFSVLNTQEVRIRVTITWARRKFIDQKSITWLKPMVDDSILRKFRSIGCPFFNLDVLYLFLFVFIWQRWRAPKYQKLLKLFALECSDTRRRGQIYHLYSGSEMRSISAWKH